MAASGKPATNTKTVAFDLTPWQNQSTENGDVKIEVSYYSYISSLNTTVISKVLQFKHVAFRLYYNIYIYSII